MTGPIGNYAQHAKYWDWGGQDRADEHAYWLRYALKYGTNVLLPMCATGETGAYMARRGMNVAAFDITPEMIDEGKKKYEAVEGLRYFVGDVRSFRFDIPPVDFCFCVDFGHIHTIEDLMKSFACISAHLRDGGCLVVKTRLRSHCGLSSHTPMQTFVPVRQIYPKLKVWKTGETRYDAKTGRRHISQVFYAQDENGHVEHFDHAFYLQSYFREELIAAFSKCGLGVAQEKEEGGDHLFEAVKGAMKGRVAPLQGKEA